MNKNKLIQERGHCCEKCLLSQWFDLPIALEIHHIDGKSNDPKNLQLLCPNCHALTPNYRGKGINTAKKISDESLIEAVKDVSNIRQLLQKLDLVPKGGNYQTIRNRLVRLNLIDKFRQPEMIKICPQCKIDFVGNRTFCSSPCSNKFNKNGLKTKKVSNRPSKEIILQMVNTMGYTATGKIFGVSDNAIRKWLL